MKVSRSLSRCLFSLYLKDVLSVPILTRQFLTRMAKAEELASKDVSVSFLQDTTSWHIRLTTPHFIASCKKKRERESSNIQFSSTVACLFNVVEFQMSRERILRRPPPECSSSIQSTRLGAFPAPTPQLATKFPFTTCFFKPCEFLLSLAFTATAWRVQNIL